MKNKKIYKKNIKRTITKKKNKIDKRKTKKTTKKKTKKTYNTKKHTQIGGDFNRIPDHKIISDLENKKKKRIVTYAET